MTSLTRGAKIKKRQPIRRSSTKHRTWQLQEAKARFSELVNAVVQDGYQTVTRYGHPIVVVISHVEFEKMRKPQSTLGTFLSESPLSMCDLDVERDKDFSRESQLLI